MLSSAYGIPTSLPPKAIVSTTRVEVKLIHPILIMKQRIEDKV